MTQQPFSTPAARGAVDLSGLSQDGQGASPAAGTPTAPRTAGAAGSPSSTAGAAPSAGPRSSVVVEATEANISQLMNGSLTVPTVLLVWSSSRGGSDTLVAFADVVRAQGGRVLLATIDVDSSPQLAQALGVQEIPMAVAVLQGQPVPLFVGSQPKNIIEQTVEKLLEVAVANGITGRVEMAEGEDAGADELSPLHQEAYDAIERGDLGAAAEAYKKAIAENPKDRDAALGLAQIALIERTADVDQAAARQAAATSPDDVDAQLLVADLDVLGGHVDDAFARLLDVVRRGGDGREKARLHLIDLFDVIGAEDERVRKARTALMSALF